MKNFMEKKMKTVSKLAIWQEGKIVGYIFKIVVNLTVVTNILWEITYI